MLKHDAYVQSKLVETGWRWSQAYGGGHIAGQMVMHVLANRVRAGWGSWLQVIDKIPLYMAENEMPVLTHPSIWEPSFVKLLQTVEGIHDGSVQDLTKGNMWPTGAPGGQIGALYWASLGNIQRQWFKDLIAAEDVITGLRQHPQVANINSLSFFR